VLAAVAELPESGASPDKDLVYKVVAFDRAAGTVLWSGSLPGEPARYGVAVAASRKVIVTLRNGSVCCFGE
jgi:hypothetical protein